MGISLYPHQVTAMHKMHDGCVVTGDVGTGKSLTALAFWYIKVCKGVPQMPGIPYEPMKTPVELYVVTTARKRDKLDWEKEGAHFAVGREPNESGVSMHVDSWNNIKNYTDIENSFFIFDEQRLVGNGSWVSAFLKIAAKNQWIMLSATPGDNWMDYVPVFIANGFYKNRSEFQRRHVVWMPYAKFPKVQRYTEQYHLSQLRDSILVDMPYERHTARHLATCTVEYDESLYNEVSKTRWHYVEQRPLKDAAELFALLRRIVNTDPSRLGETLKILEQHPKLIVFYNFNYELDMLRMMAQNINYPYAEWNGHLHQDIPQTEKWLYLVQYTAGAEGWNCIETNAMAFWSLNYSWKIFHQSQGRIDRLNTPFKDLYYYILRSGSSIDTNIWKALMSKKKFNESMFIKTFLGTWTEEDKEAYDRAA